MAAIVNNILPVVNKTIPIIAVVVMTNNILVRSDLTYREGEKNLTQYAQKFQVQLVMRFQAIRKIRLAALMK